MSLTLGYALELAIPQSEKAKKDQDYTENTHVDTRTGARLMFTS
jgi:hypothetical protein